MHVSDVAYPWVVDIQADDTLMAAATKMRRFGVGALVVYDGERMAGVLTERDVLRACVEGADPGRTHLTQYLTTDPETISADADVAEAAATMIGLNSRHLPVVDRGRVVGMVSARDLLHALAGDRRRRPARRRRTRWDRLWHRKPRRWAGAELVDEGFTGR